MQLVNEAINLYIISKEIVALNKKIKKLAEVAEKHLYKHSRTSSAEEKHYHQVKHARTAIEISHLMKKHHDLLEKLKHHHVAFDHALNKEKI